VLAGWPTSFTGQVYVRTRGRAISEWSRNVFKKLIAILISLSFGAAVLVALPGEKAVATPAPEVAPAAAPLPAAATPRWNARSRIVFNNAKGKNKPAEYNIINEINRGINSSQPGSTIHMVMYLFNITSTADALVRAHQRGVNVKFLIDDGTNTAQSRKVKRALGTNKRARSFYAVCHSSCMAGPRSTIHAKFYLFSNTGYNRPVSMVSSANPHKVNTIASWNNSHTIVGDRKIYSALVKYFNDMLKDTNRPNYYAMHPPVTSGSNTLYFFPRAARRPSQLDILNALNHTSCRTSGGYGSKGRTVIRVEMWGWTSTRKDIAKRLRYLWGKGCKVQVIINRARISRGIVATLLKRHSRYGKMPVYDAWVDRNKNDFGELYMHHKALMINGRWFGRNAKVTYTGSQNFTPVGTLKNNDIILRVMGAATYNAYARNMDYIKRVGTKRMYKVPRILRDTYGPGDQRIKGGLSPDVTEEQLLEVADR
jgi:phosphatidylserine/phosphatidylglycerophosphate/cardiolipin synthase-like enzyme